MVDDRVGLYLTIEGTVLSPSVLTSNLGINPDRTWMIGDSRGHTGEQWGSHGWSLEMVINSQDTDNQTATYLIPIAIDQFEKRIEPVANKITQIKGMSVYVVLSILANEVPGIELSNSFINLISKLGSSLQIDLMV